jgi:23S rRNA pseudouridine955/2504/2580 synthase
MKNAAFSFKDAIIYEDAHLLAINKPVGIPSLAERTNPDSGLLEMARTYLPEIRICHRLDKFTSGVLLFAKDLDSYRHIALQFEHRKVEKYYQFLAAGQVSLVDSVIQAPISEAKRGVYKVDFKEGKEAVTVFKTAEVFKNCTLMLAMPQTGRSHQIRVHAAFAGFPIIGDSIYGGPDLRLSDFKTRYQSKQDSYKSLRNISIAQLSQKDLAQNVVEERPLNHHLLLHAYKLVVSHPATESNLSIVAEINENFSVCLKLLQRYGKLRVD